MHIRRNLLAAALLLSACSPTGSDGPGRQREVPFLTWSGFEARVDLPATVQAGQPFTVRVTSFGSTCRWLAPSEVSREGLRADVAVFVLVQPGQGCNRALGTLEHAVELVFPQPGTAAVRIHGMGYGDAAPLVVERTLTVQ